MLLSVLVAICLCLPAVFTAWQLVVCSEQATAHACVGLMHARVNRGILRRVLHAWKEGIAWERLRRDAYPIMCR